MKTTTLFSKAIIALLAFMCAITFSTSVSAQTTTKKKSSQKVDINMNGNKLRLEMNDDEFDLDMVFDFDATDVIAAITNELGSPIGAGSFKIWEGNGYDIKVKNSHLDVYMDRNVISSTTKRQMENIFKELFKDLELDIDINN